VPSLLPIRPNTDNQFYISAGGAGAGPGRPHQQEQRLGAGRAGGGGFLVEETRE
jgi:hypothetical protein